MPMNVPRINSSNYKRARDINSPEGSIMEGGMNMVRGGASPMSSTKSEGADRLVLDLEEQEEQLQG